jgi:glycosyltransferase involved in cell wall biosynthesis
MPPRSPSVSVLFAILGEYTQVHRYVAGFLQDLLRSASRLEQIDVVLLVHGEAWHRTLPLAALASRGVKTTVIPSIEELPAVLFNQGAKVATGDFISFAWPGMDFEAWLASARFFAKTAATQPDAIFLAGHPVSGETHGDQRRSWTFRDSDTIPGFQGGWLEMFDYVPMGSAIVARDFFLGQGGFSCCPLLQRGFWWEFTIRVSRATPINQVDAPPQQQLWSWWEFPLSSDLLISGDLIARRALRRTGAPATVDTTADYSYIESFAGDLPMAARHRLERQLEQWVPQRMVHPVPPDPAFRIAPGVQRDAPLRILVLGGLNEPAHNQICFYNYFALVEGLGVLTWRGILDSVAHNSDLDKADLVIFSRSRSERACRLMDYCVKQEIPTVYMLDDNWFSIGSEWPEYEKIFSPGAPPYEHFRYCLVRANRVLAYNSVLAEDLRPYSQELELLPTNIDLTLFPQVPQVVGSRPRVGYVGSLRRENSAFAALFDLARERDDFEVFVMSASIPEPLNSLPRDRLVHRPYIFGYRRYAQVLCEARPSVLLAPLSSTRTDASKCPNKYLEITAASAVGIYSRTAPYDNVVRDRENGLLVDNDVAQWKRAISELLDKAQLRKNILEAAARDVRANFSTPAVLPEFLGFLKRAAASHPDSI